MTSLSSYDFSTLYTALSHNLVKDKLLNLIERSSRKKKRFVLSVTIRLFFTSTDHRRYKLWSC